MRDAGAHSAFVDAWLARMAKGASKESLLALFEAALNAVWECTGTTLGEVTLGAIADRVLHVAAERYPRLSPLKVAADGGVDLDDLRARADELRPAELRAGLRFVLVEFLTVLGNLTAEILTDDLHTALGRLPVPRKRAKGKP